MLREEVQYISTLPRCVVGAVVCCGEKCGKDCCVVAELKLASFLIYLIMV